MRRESLLFLFFVSFISSVLGWAHKAKDGSKAEGCPYMQQKYSGGSHRDAAVAGCPLKDKCPLYAAVVQGEGDVSFESLKTADINWSQAAQSIQLIFRC